MGRGSNAERVVLGDGDPRLDAVEAAIVRGQMLEALARAERIGELSAWAGPRARCVAGWLHDHLGNSRLASRYFVAEFRRSPDHPVVRYFYTFSVLRRRGPVEAWLSLDGYRVPDDAPADARAEIVGLEAYLLSCLGDHRRAAAALERCDREALGAPRFAAIEAALLERREERERAIEIVERALCDSPLDRGLVGSAASLYERANRREEALSLLQRVEPQLETAQLTSLRAALEHERGLYEAEAASLDRLERLEPKADSEARRTLAIRRAENSYLRGDLAAARAYGELSGNEHWARFAKRLEGRSGRPERERLELPVLIQEPMGCAPACLAMICKYFGQDVDHVDVADQICYEGTASHSERAWVEARGWISREFTVDFATARRLIERKIPFLLVTVDIAAAHAQVVIGYDATRETLMTRDPSSPLVGEIDAQILFERHRAYGPRGHVLLPPDKAALLDGIELPEAELHDLSHRLRVALEANDESRIQLGLRALSERAPEHPLTLWGRRSVAIRNGDPYAIRDCSEAILARFPDDANAETSVLDCMASIATEAEQRERIERRLEKRDAPWIFYERLALLVAKDAGQYAQSRRLIRRALRSVPLRGRSLAVWARIEREAGNAELSLRLRRMSATLEPTDDALAQAYFEEAFGRGQAETALELLRDRAQKYRARSGQPQCVLFQALEWLDRVQEAFEMLESALEARPGDGGLASFAAEAYARFGDLDRARALLDRARPAVSRESFEQTAARLAEIAGDPKEALERHRAVLGVSPLALGAHEAVAQLSNELFGPAAAREHLAQACKAYPTHCGLRELYVTWLRGHDPELVLPELDLLLELQPAHAWARRERALVLSDLGRHEAAIVEAEAACAMAPHQPASQRVLAAVATAAGDRERALAAIRRALLLAPDSAGTVSELLKLASSLSEQHELLDWAWRELKARSVNGDGLTEWHAYLHGLMPDSELLERVSPLVVERPSLWASYHIVGVQLVRVGEVDKAIALLRDAVARFPFIPRLSLTLADALRSTDDRAGEAAAALAALRLNPGWIQGALRAAEALEKCGDEAGARRVLERALAFHPRSAELMLAVADLSWSSGDVERAFAQVKSAIEFQPENSSAWFTFARYADTLGRNAEVVALARALTEQRPWNPHIWLQLAEILRLQSENLASIDALREALERLPTLLEASDAYAQALTQIGKKEEALAACDRPTSNFFARGALAARRAWVLWQFGDRRQACAAMRAVLAEHPDQLWGLQELVEWELELEHYDAAIELSEALVRLNPTRAVGYGYLGAAQRAAGRREDALKSFAQAARLDPGYAFAGQARVEIALEVGRTKTAEAVIAEQGPHVPPFVEASWGVMLASTRGDFERAMDALGRMLRHPSTPPTAIERLDEPLAVFKAKDLARGLSELASAPDVHPDAGALWVTVLSARRGPPSVLALLRLRRRNEASFFTALRAYFAVLGARSASWLRLMLVLICLGRFARRRDDVWGQVGWALTRARAYVACQLWLSDYRERQSIEAWMLHNYRIAALENHQPRSALGAVEHALSLPADGALNQHLAFAAFGRAASGDIDGAREIIEGRSADGLEGRAHWLFESARLLVELHDSEPDQRPLVLADLRAQFENASFALMSPFSTGLLYRWLASGVLRQQWVAGFALRRFAPWLAAVLGATLIGLRMQDQEPAVIAGALVTLSVIGASVYVVARLRT